MPRADGGGTAGPDRAAAPKALTKVTFMADYPRPPWVAQIPWVVAMNKGWYKAAGLDVKYVFPSTPADPARFIGIGRADLTVSYTPDLLTAASKGLKVKALASVFDRNVEGIMVWKDSGITTPKQLEGHTVAIYDFPMAKLNWQTFAQHYGIDTNKVKVVSEGNYGVPLMVSNKVDGIDAAAPSELVDSELQAKQSARFWVYLKQNGIPDFYWFIIAANSDWAQKNPAAAKAFVSVTMKAVKLVLPAPEGSGQHLRADVQEGCLSRARDQGLGADRQVRLDALQAAKPAGWMDPAIWKSYQQFLVKKKFLTDKVNVDDVLTGNQFVGK